VKFIQARRQGQLKQEKQMAEQYQERMKSWVKKVDKLDANPKRKARLQKARQFYEKEFPEIKKQREQQERFDRLGSRSAGFARSEAEFEEIVDNLNELEANEKQIHMLAIETPRLLDKYERRIKYINNNGLIRDVEAYESARKASIIWTDEERQIFKEKYNQFPKDFEKIASFLEKKNVPDCVLYYYQNKKKDTFKRSKSKKSKRRMPRSGQISHRPGQIPNLEDSKLHEGLCLMM
jgi:nuclear receptor co-repressor 1